jgi:glycosyltransferase involved in cell wall biosynthesis
MHLFINSLAASAGGGLTYIRNVLPLLAQRSDVTVTIALVSDLRREFPAFRNVDFVEYEMSPLRRFWFEQTQLGEFIQRSGANMLLSTGNFAIRHSAVPQILLSRNAIYTSGEYYRDLRNRREYRMWVDTHIRGWLAKKSVRWADITVAPSEAFAAELRRWTGKPVQAIHHGFDADAFANDSKPIAPPLAQKLREAKDSFKILFVSHYNYYRNFETLLRALALLPNEIGGRPVKLLLTCKLQGDKTPGSYRPHTAAEIVQQTGVAAKVLELGAVAYDQLHHVYREADLYVTPAYTETFAHPLVEAMASGLPVVASDLPVHREICQEAALYFPRFSPSGLAKSIVEVGACEHTSARMRTIGAERVREFSWKKHVDAILELSDELVRKRAVSSQA